MRHGMSAFNHYAKLRRLLADEPPGWFICRINSPTTARNFRGELRHFDHYYRLYSSSGSPIKYGKFQQLDRLAAVLDVSADELPLRD